MYDYDRGVTTTAEHCEETNFIFDKQYCILEMNQLDL